MKNEILTRVLAMPADERDVVVAEKVMGWKRYDRNVGPRDWGKGRICMDRSQVVAIINDENFYWCASRCATSDYEVLEHCREKWSYSDKTMFNHKISAINHTRDEWPWLPCMVYHIGDYSIAALATVLEVEEASGQRMDGLEKPE